MMFSGGIERDQWYEMGQLTILILDYYNKCVIYDAMAFETTILT